MGELDKMWSEQYHVILNQFQKVLVSIIPDGQTGSERFSELCQVMKLVGGTTKNETLF